MLPGLREAIMRTLDAESLTAQLKDKSVMGLCLDSDHCQPLFLTLILCPLKLHLWFFSLQACQQSANLGRVKGYK